MEHITALILAQEIVEKVWNASICERVYSKRSFATNLENSGDKIFFSLTSQNVSTFNNEVIITHW